MPSFYLILLLIIFNIILDTISFIILYRQYKYANVPMWLYKNKPIKYLFFSWIIICGLFCTYFIIFSLLNGKPGLDYTLLRSYFNCFSILLLLLLPKYIYWFYLFIAKLFKKNIISIIGLIIAIISFSLILYSITLGNRRIIIKKQTLYFKNLPASFDGFRIVHISDFHLGSFNNTDFIENAVPLINSLKADAVMFTGDMINIIANEAEPYIPILNLINANYGKFSVLGNHDLNDYRKIDKIRADDNSINRLIQLQECAGFVMLNDSFRLIIKNNDTIAIVGVKNIGLAPFKKSGNLKTALYGTDKVKFKILLSHDPSHWHSEVLNYSDIALTLSGHTHGFQVGIFNNTFKFGLLSHKYPEWLGLYSDNERYLNINAGLGVIGFSGRLGIRPEITLIELKKRF